MRHQLTARSPSPKPAGWSGAGSAGTPGRTAVRRMGPSARTSATANRRDARISRGTVLQHRARGHAGPLPRLEVPILSDGAFPTVDDIAAVEEFARRVM